MDPTLEPVEELKNTETVTPTKVPRERTEAQKLALSKARERAMEVRSANAELRKKQNASSLPKCLCKRHQRLKNACTYDITNAISFVHVI